MSLLSEQLVEEYYNRKSFLTIRGAKRGNDEIDILAIQHQDDSLIALHIEVHTAFRPIAFLSNRNAGALHRTDGEVNQEMGVWIHNKYLSPAKVALRSRVWPDIEWKFVFCHARMRDPRELTCLSAAGITLLSFADVISDIAGPRIPGAFVANAGGDISEIVRFHGETNAVEQGAAANR